jgi:acyl-coenzyme A thioesterase PaaI-like protein
MTTPTPETPENAQGWFELMRRLSNEPPSPRRVEMHRIGDALRTIVHRLHGSDAPVEVLAEAADGLEALARKFGDLPGRSLYDGLAESTLLGDPAGFFDHGPMLGRANALAPPLKVRLDGDVMRATGTFGAAYEGPPGCVHGGYVAAAFDEVLGATQSLGGRPGMTAKLVVDYRSPTPLLTELRFEGRVERVEGRKTFTVGTLHAGDRLCAEAEGLFVSIDAVKMSGLMQERDRRTGG